MLLHAFKFHLNIILCVFICSFLFSLNIVRSLDVMCIVVVHSFSYPSVWLCLRLCIHSTVSDYLGCSLAFAISNNVVLNILCVSPSHAHVQESLLGSGSETSAAYQNHLEGLLNHRLLGSTTTVFDSVCLGLGPWEFAFLTSSQVIPLLRVQEPHCGKHCCRVYTQEWNCLMEGNAQMFLYVFVRIYAGNSSIWISIALHLNTWYGQTLKFLYSWWVWDGILGF